MYPEQSLLSRIAAILPGDVTIRVYHVSTDPSPASALFVASPGGTDEPTTCESHYLAVATPATETSPEIIVYALEVLIFSSPTLTTIFVSKADSSGFISKLRAPKTSPSLVANITTTFVEFLLEPRLSHSRVVLSLFARAQHAYLFPGSAENEGKHVLDDRQLIKWWCRVLDKVLRAHDGNVASVGNFSATAHLLVPGCERAETRGFFPPSSRLDAPSEPKWINSYPVQLLVQDADQPPRCLVPRLPDDPKARFLDDLDGDSIDERGQWRSVKNLDTFWEMMSYRQECAAGRLVGFLWMVFSQVTAPQPVLSDAEQVEEPWTESPTKISPAGSVLLPGRPSEAERNAADLQPHAPSEQIGHSRSPLPPPPLSPSFVPIVATADNVANGAHEHSQHRERAGLAQDPTPTPTPQPAVEVTWYRETRGEILLSADQYQTLMHQLLSSDFAGATKAASASHDWVHQAKELFNTPNFGATVHGQLARSHATPPRAPPTPPAVNVLTGIRKRKAPRVDDGTAIKDDADQAAGSQPVNVLPAGLVRKKTKTQEF